MLNLTTYESTNAYTNTINIADLLQFEVIIFKVGLQALEQVHMHKVTSSSCKKVAACHSAYTVPLFFLD